jgi:transposase
MAVPQISDEAKEHWLRVFHSLNEAQRRWFAGQRAIEWGRGGVSLVSEQTGLSRNTVSRGVRDLKSGKELDGTTRLRAPGAGRKKVEEMDPDLFESLEGILKETTSGDPMSALRWTTKSIRSMANELTRRKHPVGVSALRRILAELGYSLQANRKTQEGGDHPDRDAQFRKINAKVRAFQEAGQPVVSIDGKKKERVGEFKNGGRTWRPKGEPSEVNVYDFQNLAIGTAVPYGIYDVQRNSGMVNVGQSADTAQFAVESIRQWWKKLGRRHYPDATELLLCADGGGSNSSRARTWKYFLQELSDETGLAISVCHFPPGTSKWNKIEHRMFSYISLNWRGQPLVNYETILNLIGSTKTQGGLQVKALLDPYIYEKGIEISDEEMKQLELVTDSKLPKWNYTLHPRE